MIDMHDVGRHLTVAEMSARGGNPEAVNRVGILSENLEALGKEAKTQRAMGRAGLVATIAQFGAGLFLLSDAENK